MATLPLPWMQATEKGRQVSLGLDFLGGNSIGDDNGNENECRQLRGEGECFPTNKDFWVITAAMTMNVWKQEGRTHIFRPVKMILRNAKDYMSDLSMMLKFYLWMVIWAEQAFVGQWTQVNVSSLQINSKLHSERCLFIPPDFTIKALIGGRHSAWKLVRAREEQESRDKEHVVQRDTLGTVHCWAAVPCTAAARINWSFSDETRNSLWVEWSAWVESQDSKAWANFTKVFFVVENIESNGYNN